MIHKKLTNLDKYNYSLGDGFTLHLTYLTYNYLSKYFYGENCIELGCADGYGTKILLKHFKKVVSVDGSHKMISKLMKNVKSNKLTVINSYFENLNLKEKFDTIMMSHVLDTVDDPIQILAIVKRLAHPKTSIIIEVPNAMSVHRQAGVLLGLLKNEYHIGPTDVSVGHKKIYDMELLLKDLKKSGLKVTDKGGFMLKAFSNSQMQKIIDGKQPLINAYAKLGEKYPDIAAEIFAVCKIR